MSEKGRRKVEEKSEKYPKNVQNNSEKMPKKDEESVKPVHMTDSILSIVTEKVTEIKTNIFVTSFGPVSDTEMVRNSFIKLHSQLKLNIITQPFLYL